MKKNDPQLYYALRALLNLYLSGTITMNQLEDWVVKNLQQSIDLRDIYLKVVNLTTIFDDLDGMFIQIGENIATEEELKVYVRKVVETL